MLPHPQKVLGNSDSDNIEPWPLLCGRPRSPATGLHLGYPQHLLIQQHTLCLAGKHGNGHLKKNIYIYMYIKFQLCFPPQAYLETLHLLHPLWSTNFQHHMLFAQYPDLGITPQVTVCSGL